MTMGGFVGKVEYVGKTHEFLPVLTLGEKVHVGKATGFGLGRYVIDESGSRATNTSDEHEMKKITTGLHDPR